MAGQPGFFDGDERLKALSAAGDSLERLALVVDFEVFRDALEAALSRSDRSKGGRPPYDPVVMFKVLVLQTLYTLSDDQTEYQLKDRLSFMRFIGLALHDPVLKPQICPPGAFSSVEQIHTPRLPDGSGFVYQNLSNPKDPYSGQIRFHRIGTDPARDAVLFRQFTKDEDTPLQYGLTASAVAQGLAVGLLVALLFASRILPSGCVTMTGSFMLVRILFRNSLDTVVSASALLIWLKLVASSPNSSRESERTVIPRFPAAIRFVAATSWGTGARIL
jgi:hypothetical protein